MGEYLLRFLIGGLAVSLFSAVGELWTPKRFAGIFAAAPSVALGTLGLAFSGETTTYAVTEASTMLIGVVALVSYTAACVYTGRVKGLPVWMGASASWLVWFAIAAVGFWLAGHVLGSR